MSKVILLTGFEPFGLYSFNPTMDIVSSLNGKFFTEESNDFLEARKIVSEILPATYDAFKYLFPLVNKHNPYAIVNLGFSSSVKGLQFENSFSNKMGDSKYPDAKGINPVPVTSIIKDGEESLTVDSNFDELIDRLRLEEIPAYDSLSAGTYICNALGYYVAHKIKNEGLKTKQVFLHMPCTSNYKDQVNFDPAEGKIFLDTDLVLKGLKMIFKNI